jgi:hypothetical protein
VNPLQALLLQLVEATSPATGWILIFVAIVVIAFVVYVGVVLMAALSAKTPQEQRYRLRLLREFLRFVLDLSRPGKDQ